MQKHTSSRQVLGIERGAKILPGSSVRKIKMMVTGCDVVMIRSACHGSGDGFQISGAT